MGLFKKFLYTGEEPNVDNKKSKLLQDKVEKVKESTIEGNIFKNVTENKVVRNVVNKVGNVENPITKKTIFKGYSSDNYIKDTIEYFNLANGIYSNYTIDNALTSILKTGDIVYVIKGCIMNEDALAFPEFLNIISKHYMNKIEFTENLLIEDYMKYISSVYLNMGDIRETIQTGDPNIVWIKSIQHSENKFQVKRIDANNQILFTYGRIVIKLNDLITEKISRLDEEQLQVKMINICKDTFNRKFTEAQLIKLNLVLSPVLKQTIKAPDIIKEEEIDDLDLSKLEEYVKSKSEQDEEETRRQVAKDMEELLDGLMAPEFED